VTDADVTAHIGYMESMLAHSAWTSVVFLFIGLPFVAIWAFSRQSQPHPIAIMPALALLVVGFSAVRFRGICRATRGWLAGFIRYHVMVYLLALTVILIEIPFGWVAYHLIQFRSGAFRTITLIVLAVTISTSLIVLYWRVIHPFRRRAIASIAPLSRDVAQRLARLDRRDERSRGPLRYRSWD
jgi:hypothetical protein